MQEDKLKILCARLKPLIGDKADALWLAYITAETPELRNEAASFIQFVVLRHLGQKVDDKKILLPPPDAKACAGDIHLGTVVYKDRDIFPLFLRKEEMMRHVAVFGVTGSGKTNCVLHVLEGLLDQDVPFLVVDWKRSYRGLLTLKSEKAKNIQVFTVGRRSGSPLNFNPLRGPPNVHPRTWISACVEALEKSHISGLGVADIMIEILDKKFDEFGFYEGKATKYPNFYDVADELKRMNLKGRRMLWLDSCRRIIRTLTFGPAAGAFNARNPVEIEKMLENPIVFEIDLELPKPLRVFISEVILRWIHLYRLGQGETENLRHCLVLEEVHNLLPVSDWEKAATNSLEIIFREIRSFGESIITITQHPSLVPIYLLGNSTVQVFFGLSHERDIKSARESLFLDWEDDEFLDRLPVGQAIVKIKNRIDPCLVKIPKVDIQKGLEDSNLAWAPPEEKDV